jgi:hypothetical protein
MILIKNRVLFPSPRFGILGSRTLNIGRKYREYLYRRKYLFKHHRRHNYKEINKFEICLSQNRAQFTAPPYHTWGLQFHPHHTHTHIYTHNIN